MEQINRSPGTEKMNFSAPLVKNANDGCPSIVPSINSAMTFGAHPSLRGSIFYKQPRVAATI